MVSAGKYVEHQYHSPAICLTSCLTDGLVYWSTTQGGVCATVKKCSRGKGTRLTPSLRRSLFSWPGNRKLAVNPDVRALHILPATSSTRNLNPRFLI